MSATAKEYVKASILVLIFILLVFVFDLPKVSLVTIVIVIPIVLFFNAIFPRNKKHDGRKSEYAAAALFFVMFALITFVFDLPQKLYLFFGILTCSFVVLYELFNL